MIQNAASDQERYERAKQRVEVLRGFYGHALVFVLVNIGLAAYNVATTPDRLWFVLTVAGWGIGLFAHAAYVFGSGRFFGAGWQERKIREEMDRDQRRFR
jgi:2TM domain-containing protein